ncbi:MAG TPA: hypothetical protein VJ853_14795 [Thermoanaerobaculia bacterium]|nr:hypothetical protein [Thermoanaerobaculia bacterium]
MFAFCPTQLPQLIAPANNATNIASPVLFDWNDVPNATGYRVWAAFNGGNANVIALTTDSEYSINVPAGPIEWWVDALGDSSCTTVATSQHFHFTAVGGTGSCPQNPSSPNLLTPAANATGLASPVALSWSAVPGSSGYRVFVSLNGGAPVLAGSTQSTQIALPFPKGNVTWFVEAQFAGCPSTFSRFGAFTVTTGASCSNTAAALISPANNATVTTSPVTFQWGAVSGAIGYKLFINGDLAGETTDTSLVRLVGNGAITWRVDTEFAACPDVASSTFTFTVPAPSCSGSISLTSPAEGATVSSPVSLAWTTVPNATAYRIWVSVDGGPPVIIARSAENAQTQALPSGSIEWYVEALFASCPSILSPHGHMTVSKAATCGSNQAPTLVSPLSGTQAAGPVTFTWNPVNGALLYRVWVSADGDPFEDIGVTKNTTLQEDVGTGTIQWYVEALFTGCPAVASNKATFSIPQEACSTTPTILISPADGASNVTAPVTLVWSAVPNATGYRVWSKNAAGNKVVIAKTGGDQTSVDQNLPPGTIEWWVESDFDSCAATKSVHEKFTIARAANCTSDVPQLVTPPNGSSTVGSPVQFSWNPVSGAVGYALIVQHDGGAATILAETTNTTVTRRLPEGAFEWYVVAAFAGCPPAVSQHSTFSIPVTTCSTRQPILMTPADGATGLTSTVHFSWAAVPKATGYKIWAATDDDDQASVLTTTTTNKATLQMPSGDVDWYVEAILPQCPSVTSAVSGFSVRKNAPACATPPRPVAKAPADVQAGTPFTISWNSVINATNYELQESTSLNFSAATTQTIADTSITLTRSNPGINPASPFRYFYRVRAVSNCSDDRSAYSKIVSVVVTPQTAKTTSVDVGVQNGVTQQIALPPQNPPVQFTARGDKPYMTVTPASGTVGPNGATLTVTFDPSALKLGTNTGTVLVSYGSASGPIHANGVQPVIPVSVSLVTPVAPTGKNTPPPNSLIIPAVGHAPGANNSMFESDVRVANTSAQTQKYQLNFTLTGTDGTQSGQSSTIEINPGDTMALDDILSNFFGVGSDGGAATGVLEIRPLTADTTSLTTTPSVQTVASSRTFDTTPNGTFGQFIPAIPFSQFVAQGSRLSLQQVAQSAAYRTNIGLVEAAGQPASVLLHVFDNTGTEVATIPENLLPSEQIQLNNILPSLTDGRVEVEVTSPTGMVTAYASVVDNVTNDPLLVSPVLKGSVSAQSYTLPGVGDFMTGNAHWKSDVRIYNSASSPASVTLAYYAQGNAANPSTATKTIAANSELAIDDLIHATWPQLGHSTAGSLVVTTSSSSSLVTTARTYTQLTSGTYGQFIPGVTAAQAAGNGDQPLQILQLESSTNYRTNIGLAETSGHSATVHVSLVVPDSKVAIGVDIPLAAYEFKQFSLDSFGAGTVYNGRVSVSVTSGTGRVTAYGSVIDQTTQDPTYVPAQ